MAVKLTPRLAQLAAMVRTPYPHIWDCCCDHGYLGMTLLARPCGGIVHFVDVVPELMQQLECQLQRFFPRSDGGAEGAQWQSHCDDVGQLTLPPTDVPQLLLIAGVGGELTAELVTAVLAANPEQPLEFLLCPVRHQYPLRQQLIQLGLKCLDEQLIEDNRRYYEILHLSTESGMELTPTGNVMWDFGDPMHQRYLQQVIAHYQRLALGHPAQCLPILTAYQSLLSNV
ncbi:MAG: tRNA (adenine(22)-N(1))-methyltransferase TrmK [Marinobacterium sp.]|nr:tRNA (adenine(22)-N(1))-methyltransferase TrmK [Marinobacterium sp.]